MKLLSAIILIHSLLFAQDILTDISGRQARGQLIEVTETHVVFQLEGAKAPSSMPANAILMVTLADGTVAYDLSTHITGDSEVVSPEFVEVQEKRAKEAKLKASVHGHKLSKLYHRGTVDHLPTEFQREIFAQPKQAESSGYRPCPACFDTRPALTDYYLEKEISTNVNAAIRNRYEILYEHPKLALLDNTMDKLLSEWTETTKGYHYRILIMKDEDPNAFAVAGGNIYVTSGLIEMIEDDAELEFILAHEIAHVERRHTLRQFKEMQRKNLIASVVALTVGVGILAAGGETEDAALATELTALMANFANILAMQGYSRELEQESDIFAQLQLSQRNIDAIRMTKALDKLATYSLIRGQQITVNAFSDHPSLKARIKQVKESNLIVLDDPIDFHLIPQGSPAKPENSLLTLSTRFIHEAPSSNKKDEDVLTLIGNLKNHSYDKDYQIDDISMRMTEISDFPIKLKNVKGLAIQRNSEMDFATSISVTSDKSGLLVERLNTGQISASSKLSLVEIKRGEGAKKKWSTGSVQVSTFVRKRK